MKRSLLLLISCLLCGITLAAHSPIPTDTIPFEIRSDHRIYVKTHINGDTSKIFTFLVDTGASTVVLNSALPHVMEMAKFESTIVNQGPTSKETIPATLPTQSLQVGKNIVNGLTFIAIPYPPTAWDGVLGLSFLQMFNVGFNYDRKEMYLSPKNKATNQEGTAIPFEYRLGVPVIPVTVTINNVLHKLYVEVDTGSDRILDINTPYVDSHKLRGTLPVFAISTINGTSATTGKLENVCFDYADIGNTRFPVLPGAFSSVQQGVQATREFDGVIGNHLMQRFNQTWDFTNQKLYLTPNHRFYTPFYDFLIAK